MSDKIFVDFGGDGMRVDRFLTFKLKNFSRTRVQKIIKSGGVFVNDKVSKTGCILREGDEILIDFGEKTNSPDIKAEKFNLPVLFENKDFFVIDKPYGMVTHPSETGYLKGTVANAVKSKVMFGVGDKFRPGIVHRLDKDTSGVLIIAKTKRAYDSFIEQFKKRTIKKFYLALCKGIFDSKEGIIDSPISRDVNNRKRMGISNQANARKAISCYKVLKEFHITKEIGLSLVEVEIKTGRTHQIRVHMAAIGHYVIGDKTYGVRSFNKKIFDQFGLKRQFLHASKIILKSPVDGKVVMINSELSEDLKGVLDDLSE